MVLATCRERHVVIGFVWRLGLECLCASKKEGNSGTLEHTVAPSWCSDLNSLKTQLLKGCSLDCLHTALSYNEFIFILFLFNMYFIQNHQSLTHLMIIHKYSMGLDKHLTLTCMLIIVKGSIYLFIFFIPSVLASAKSPKNII